MHTGENTDDEEIKRRHKLYYGEERKAEVNDEEMIGLLREKWENLSEYIKEVKQGFSRFYNKRHGRKGFFWSERFTLLNSMRSFGDILCLCATE